MTMANWQELIESLDGGRVGEQLGEVITELIEAVEIHGSPGEVTLKLKVDKKANRATVTPAITFKIPREPLAETQLWFADGELRRENPRQVNLPLREQDEAEVR